MAFTIRGMFGMDTASLDAGLSKGRKKVESWTQDVTKNMASKFAAVFAVGALKNAVSSIVKFGSNVLDMSQRLQMSTDDVQKYMFAAEQTGATIDDVATALKRLAQGQRDASIGTKTAVRAFDAFGISIDGIEKRKPEDILAEIGKKAREGELNTVQLASAVDLLGRGAQKLLPALKAGFSDFAKQAEAMNLIINPENIAALKKLGDEFTTFAFKVRTAVSEVMPLLNLLSNVLQVINKSQGSLLLLFPQTAGLKNMSTTADFINKTAFGNSGNEPSQQPIQTAAQSIKFVASKGWGDLARELEKMRLSLEKQNTELKDINRNTRETASIF